MSYQYFGPRLQSAFNMRSVVYSLNFELAVPWNKRSLNVRLFSDRSKSECGKNKKVAQCD